jgi:hypothetical protein
MPTVLIRNFPTVAPSPDANDYIALDGSTGGSRKWSSSHFQNLGVTDSPAFSNVADSRGNLRDIPQNAQTSSYTLVGMDAGKHISTTAGIIIPSGVFASGECVSIFNNSGSNIAINATAVTCYLAGTATTGSRTLGQRGLCSILCVGTNTFVIAGAGLT